MHSRPTTDIASLQQRAALLTRLRHFFADRNILEVETPLLCRSGITDPTIEPFILLSGDAPQPPRFLQT